MAMRWSDDEKNVVREIWKLGEPVASLLHRLPGRTEFAVCKMAEKLGLPGKVVTKVATCRDALLSLLADAAPRTQGEMAAAVGFSLKQVRLVVAQLADGGQIHIAEYREPYNERIYVWGAGENAPRRQPLTRKQIQIRCVDKREARKPRAQQRYRSSRPKDPSRVVGAWWPAADVAVEQAMRGMVLAGRIAA